MRKPWEETGSHREFGSDRTRRMDRREDRGQFERRSDRREDGFGRREGGFERRDDRRFGERRFERDANRSFGRRLARRTGASGQRDERQGNLFGVRSGPRARAAVLNRRESNRAFDATNASRNALVTLDADVARVFGSSEAVNAALRQLIALAQLMGPQALSQASKEVVEVETVESEDKVETVIDTKESSATEASSETVQDCDEEEEWFEIPEEVK